jgi:hypothetical protein
VAGGGYGGGGGEVSGASKIKLIKVNKKRTVTVRRVIIFLNISRCPLLICYNVVFKTLKAMATATAAIVLLTPAKNLKKVFWGFKWSPPCLIIFWDRFKYIRGGFDRKKLIPKPLRGSKLPLFWRFIEFFRSKKIARKISP